MLLEVHRGPLRVTLAGRGQPEAASEDRTEIPRQTVVATDSTAGRLVMHSRGNSEAIVATAQLYDDTEVVLLSADSPRFAVSSLAHQVVLEVRAGREVNAKLSLAVAVKAPALPAAPARSPEAAKGPAEAEATPAVAPVEPTSSTPAGEPAESTEAPPSPADQSTPPFAEAMEETAADTSNLGWILMGVGVVSLVGGGVATFLALDAKDDQDRATAQYDESDSAEDYERLKNARARASSRQTWSIVLYGAGAASGTAGLLLLTGDSEGDDVALHLRAVAGPASLGVVLGGSF